METLKEEKKILFIQKRGLLFFETLKKEVKIKSYSIKFHGKGNYKIDYVDFVLIDAYNNEYEYFALNSELNSFLNKFQLSIKEPVIEIKKEIVNNPQKAETVNISNNTEHQITLNANEKIYIGKHIEEVLKNSRIGVTEFAKTIGLTRNVIYDIFKRESIDTDLLQTISKALNFNFFSLYTFDTIKNNISLKIEVKKQPDKEDSSEIDSLIHELLTMFPVFNKKDKSFSLKAFEDSAYELNWNNEWQCLIYPANIESTSLILNSPNMHNMLLETLIQMKIFILGNHKNLDKKSKSTLIKLFINIQTLLLKVNALEEIRIVP